MNIRHVMAPLAVSFASLLAGTAEAQTPDLVALHPGQWGAEFQIGNGFFGAGALRFTSPTHAWLLDLSAGYDHTTAPGAPITNSTVLGLDLGTRAYRSFGRRLERLITFGAVFSYARQRGGGVTAQSIGGGPFASLGATWLITPHLGVGAQWRADITYTHGTVSFIGGSGKSDDLRVSLGGMRLMGQLYF